MSKAAGRRPAVALAGVLLVALVAGSAALALTTRSGPTVVAAPTPAASGRPSPAPSPSVTGTGGSVASLPADTILAWTPGGLPSGFAGRVERLPGVAHVVVVRSGIVPLARADAASGAVVSHPPTGMFIPVEVAAASPRALAPFWPASLRPSLGVIARGLALLGNTSARIRHLGPGGVLVVSHVPTSPATSRIVVGGVVPDAAIGAAEVFVSPRSARSLGVTRARYLLVDPLPGAGLVRMERAIEGVAPPDVPLRLRRRGQTPFLRQGDAVLAPVMVKRMFGEFAASPPNAAGWFREDPAWVGSHIVTVAVPILGRVTCNRRIVPQLRAALREIRSRGLSDLIDPGDYGGCFAPRLLTGGDRTAGPGHHAWGVAIDIDVSRNPFGGRPTQDPRIVAIFRRWGFTWGGRWLVPDGMHFEAVRVVRVAGA